MSTQRCSATICTAILLASSTGCDDVDWPDPRHIDSLRILGVESTPPTLLPGESTLLSVVCADGSRGPRHDPACNVEVAWFAQCNNPERNEPESCFDRYTDWTGALAPRIADTPAEDYPEGFGFGPTFLFGPPEDILSGEVELDGRSERYGTSYVFFAVCAGHLVPVEHVRERLPVECRDRETGKALDQRRFVVGVATVFTYENVQSPAPALLGPRFDGIEIPPSCGSAGMCPEGFECTDESDCAPVVQPCTAGDSTGCTDHCLTFDLGIDSFSLLENGNRLESPLNDLWLDYFTNAGELPEDDASFGLLPPKTATDTRRTECLRWRPPSTPTDHAHLWAVARNNRGGLSVWDQRIVVR